MGERTLMLIGAGHAHLGVIDALRKEPLPGVRTVLIEPLDAMHYSGMVPGWLAGEYRLSEITIPLAPLAKQVRLEWYRARLVSLDPHAKAALLDNGEVVRFDVCSIATGGAARAATVLGRDPRLLDIRPMDRFIAQWQELSEAADPPSRVVVIGGGAGGVELALGIRNAAFERRAKVKLIAGIEGLLPDHAGSVGDKVRRELERQGIELIEAAASFSGERLYAGTDIIASFDLVVAAVGRGAPDWPRASGLPVDKDGFILVDEHQSVCGFPMIFAAGDVARRVDRHIQHSGVHAVYAGPVLASNLRQTLSGQKPDRIYRGLGMDFYLLNTGRGEAIMSYSGLALQGRWLRRLKDWLDRRWIRRFTR